MPKLSTSVTVAVPPEKAWELLSDTSRYEQWVAFTDRMIDPGEGDMRVGLVYKEHGGVPPFKADSEWRVTEFDPPRRMRHIGDDGTASIDLVIEVEASDGGCRVSPSMEIVPRWYMQPIIALMWPLMMRGRVASTMEETLANAKRLLEESAAES